MEILSLFGDKHLPAVSQESSPGDDRKTKTIEAANEATFRRPCWNDDDDDDDENDECRSLARIKNTANHGLPVKRASRFSLPRFEPARRLSIPHRRNSSRMKFSRKRGCHDSSRRFFLETTSRSSFPFARNITA